MTAHADRRTAQVAAMADPDRVSLLSLVLSARTGSAAVSELGGVADEASVRGHLDLLVQVDLLAYNEGRYWPTHDALVRFGSLAKNSLAPEVGNHDRVLDQIADSLTSRFSGVFAPETVRQFVRDSYDLIAHRATVRQFLPQLTERFAIDRLDALASIDAEGGRWRDDVLFVCVKNAGRSQIAAALMRARAHGLIRVRTAGSAPARQLDPAVRAELARRGVDLLTEFPRPLTGEVVLASGVVVTMGCGDACPVVPGRRYLDWPVEDPAGRPTRVVREIVDEITARVDGLANALGVPSP